MSGKTICQEIFDSVILKGYMELYECNEEMATNIVGELLFDESHFISEILPYLYVSNQQIAGHLPETNPSPADAFAFKQKALTKLKQLNIKAIVHILTDRNPLYIDDDIKYLTINIGDTSESPILQYFNAVHTFIETARDNNENVLIHCSMGSSRSGSICTSYLMRKFGLKYREAVTILLHARPICSTSTFETHLLEEEAYLNYKKVYELPIIKCKHPHCSQTYRDTNTICYDDFNDLEDHSDDAVDAADVVRMEEEVEEVEEVDVATGEQVAKTGVNISKRTKKTPYIPTNVNVICPLCGTNNDQDIQIRNIPADDKWICVYCTYHNNTDTYICEMCENGRYS
jgi:protein-tyrosine phosphatase